ncbi:MAG TPA: ADOP family duplicated permease [Thermoanaerobaculia bacterium]|nr:ADOP family duplicated permease [Thermoanaerobaculia bacterium]
MSSRAWKWLARVLLRLTLRTHPSAGRRLYAAEIERDLLLLTGRRARERGPLAAGRLGLRILLDVAVSGVSARHRGATATARVGPACARRTTKDSRYRTIDALRGDLRDGWRSLRGAPGTTLAAVLLLALGVGANVAVWGALRATLLAEIDAPEPERLVVARLTLREPGSAEIERLFPWSYPKYRTLRATEGRLVDPVAGYATRTVTVTGSGDAFRVEMQIADPAYFELLGGRPVLGGSYSEDSVRSQPLVALLSHALWSSRFGADPTVVGRRILVNGRPLSVIGVLAPSFRGLGGESGLWVPFEAVPSLLNPRQLEWPQAHWLNVLGRLREGTEPATAREQMRSIGRAIAEAHPDEGATATMAAEVTRLSEVRRNAAAERAVRLLAVAACAVLAIACANLATLLLGRGARRARDASIRQALGAGRWQVIRGSLVEAWLVSSLGALAGLAVAVLARRWIASAWPEQFVMGEAQVRYADLEPAGLDASALAVALVLAWGAALVIGIVPAWRVARSAPAPALRAPGGDTRSGGRGLGGRDLLVAAQVALTLVLLAATGLLVQSLARLGRVATGVTAPEQVLSARYDLARSAAGADDPAAFHSRLAARLRTLPAVRAAAVASASPFAGHTWITAVRRIDGRTDFAEGERPAIGIASVDDSYFATLGAGLVAGRVFDSRDRGDSPPVAVLSRSAGRELFGDEAPIGRRLALGIGLTPSGTDAMAEVIGVVEDVLYERPDRGVFPDAYVSVRQEPFGDAVLLVRSAGSPEELVGPVRAALAELDPEVPLHGVATLHDLRRGGMGDTRVLGGLLGAFAAVGLILAAVGTYGVMSCWVDGRRRDLGLRMALGARADQLVGLVLGRGLRILALGTLLGGVGAFAAARLLQGVLYRVEARDPLTLGVAAVLLAAVGLIACWLPARRAARTDPNAVLRDA